MKAGLQWIAVSLLLWGLFAVPGAQAQTRKSVPAQAQAKPASWQGPRVELSYRLYSLSDAQGGGLVNSAAFAGFLPTRFIRAGGGVEAGARHYSYGSADALFSGNLFVGYQHLNQWAPFVPYAVLVGELGVLLEKRFHTPITHGLRGAGVEVGGDVNLIRSLYVGVGLSFMLYTMDDLAYETLGLRLSVGL